MTDLSRRGLLATAALAGGAALLPAQSSLAQAAPWRPPEAEVTSLGIPLSDVLVLGGVVAPGPDGSDCLWVCTGGKPAKLHCVKPLTGAVLLSFELTNSSGGAAEGGYGVTATADGSVYVGTYYDGRLYRYRPGATAIEDLGQAAPPSTYVFRLAVSDGVVYGGTYSGGVVFAYDPATDTFRDYGQAVAGVPYVRSVAASATTVYAGTQPEFHLIALDPATGAKRELPRPDGVGVSGNTISDLNVYDGLLYARYGPSIINATLGVYDLAADQWVDSIRNVAGLDVSAPGPRGEVYFTLTDGARGELASYDPATRVVTRLGVFIPGRVANSRGIGWTDLQDAAWPGRTLVQMLWRGAVLLYNPATGRSATVASRITGEPIRIWAMATGANDVYVGGYLNGGLGIHDPATGETTFHRFAQIESILEDERRHLWLGTYPDARLYDLDLDAVWNNPEYSPGPIGSPPNPRLVTDLKSYQQMRVPAVADLGGQVVFGTQGHNELTGSLAFVAKDSLALDVVRGPIPEQGVWSLAAHAGLLYGGTSIYGAYSVPAPTTGSGHLFSFDPASMQLRWQVVLTPGQAAVTGVCFDAKDRLWAIANGTVFMRNRRNGDPMRAFALAADTSAGSQRGDIAHDPRRNLIWALVQQRELWAIDAQTGKRSLVSSGDYTRMTLHPSGDVYVARQAELLRFRLR